MSSAKHAFIRFDILSFFLIISILFFILYYLQINIKNGFIQSQKMEVRKIDTIFQSILNERNSEFNYFISNESDRQNLSSFMDNFSDLYIINEEYKIKKIFKKDENSQLFIGYDFSNSQLFSFFRNIWTFTPTFSPLYMSAENEGLSIYISAKLKNETYVGRIGIDKINRIVKSISEYGNNIIILATKDGYIVSSTSINIPFSILPDYDQNEILLDQPYLYTRFRSNFLSNDIVMLTPMSKVYSIIKSIRDIYPLFFTLILLIFAIKFIVQYAFIFKPLSRFYDKIRMWDSTNFAEVSLKEESKILEIELLQEVFHQKASQISQYINDVNEKTEEILHIKQYLKNIIDSMPSILITISSEGVIHEWNEAAIKYYNINAQEAIGQVIWDFLPLYRKYKDIASQVLINKQSIEYKKEIFRMNEDRYMNVTLFPLAENGNRGIALRLEDVTQLEKAESMLRQSQKMDSLGMLAGGISHDFNNILGGIIGTISMLKVKMKNTDDLNRLSDTLNEYIQMIDDASHRASELVTQLLTISRKQEPSKTYFDLREVLIRIEKICRNTFDKSIEIQFEVPETLCLVYADGGQIDQVLLNVCINANHAMTIMKKNQERNGGLLRVQLDKTLADKSFLKNHLKAEEHTSYWKLSILDTGVGISSEILSKIFDPFFTTKTKDKGNGLGLSMVYSIIEQHNGFIDVYSEIDQGTSINIYLPVPVNHVLDHEQITESEIIKGTGMILVVDDELMIRHTYKEMLEECGYQVILAENGFEGIDQYVKHKDEIVLTILDMSMPRKSGMETFSELKLIKSDIKVLMASGFRQDERVMLSLTLGVSDFLQKPFTINQLSKIVSEIINS